jgi:hypothetical protein
VGPPLVVVPTDPLYSAGVTTVAMVGTEDHRTTLNLTDPVGAAGSPPSRCSRATPAPNNAPDDRRTPDLSAGTYGCAREGVSLATSNPRFWRRPRHARPVDLACSGTDLDLRPDRSDGAIWTACWG